MVGSNEAHIAATCWFHDEREQDAPKLLVVGWFDELATFGAGTAAAQALTAEDEDGFLAVLDERYALERLVQFGGPGDARAEDCGGISPFVAGRFGGSLVTSGVEQVLTATSGHDVFQYYERLEERRHRREWITGVELVVAGEVDSVFVGGHPSDPHPGGTFAGTIEVYPDRDEPWSASSAGDLDGFYARPDKPILVTGPGRDTIRALASQYDQYDWHADGVRLFGAVSAGASVVNDHATAAAPTPAGGTDALLAWIGHFGAKDDEPWFDVLTFGAVGDDELTGGDYVVTYESANTGTYGVATFAGGAPGAVTRWSEVDLVAVGGTDVVLHFLPRDMAPAEHALVVGSPGEDSILYAAAAFDLEPQDSALTGGLITGQFTEGPFTAPGLPPLEACGAATTWILEYAYDLQEGYSATWLGGGCGLTVREIEVSDGRHAVIVADHAPGAWIELPARTWYPPDPPSGGTGAFVAWWSR